MDRKKPLCLILAFLLTATINAWMIKPVKKGSDISVDGDPGDWAGITPIMVDRTDAPYVLCDIKETGPPLPTDKMALWNLSSGPHLRGANIYQRRVYPELDGPDFMGPGPVGPPYAQEDFDRLAALNANYVVISHPGLFAETTPYTLDQGIQDNLDNLLDMIAKADMFAVISFRTGPGRSEFTFFLEEVGDWFDESYLNDAVWQDTAAQDAWVAMWRYTAERYRDNPIVVGYNLMVEPNANEVWLDIWDPEEFYANYGGTLYDWNQLYPRITTAIREVDADTPILIGGMSYSTVEWLPYIKPTGDPRTVYSVHQYEPFLYTHQRSESQDFTYPGIFDTDWDGEDDLFNQVWLENLLSTVGTFAVTHGVPVAVDEFGVMRWEPGAADFVNDQMDLFEQHGVNYALWVWDPSWEPWTEEDAFNFRHGPDPDNHADVASSDLIEVIIKYWGRNTIRPSSITFYVAPHGDDAGPGTLDQPWRTIQHAAETMVAGDTVFIRDGVYNEQVSTVRDGNAVDGYIVFSAYPGETPVIDATGVTTGDTGFFVSHSYIKLTGLEICNWDTGIWMEKGGHVEVSDCEVHDVWYGIGAADGAHDFELNRVEIHHFSLYGFDASPSGGADCYNGIFNDCIAHTCRDPGQNVDGFALGHGNQHDFVFNRCEVYDVYDGFDISARNTILKGCSAHDCGNAGYKIWQDNVTLVNCLSYHNEVTNVELDWDGEPGTTTLRNCHFVDSQTYNIWVENSADSLLMYNCIVACGDNIGLAIEHLGVDNYRGDYNVFHNDNPDRGIVVWDYEPEFSLNRIAAGDWTTYSGQDQHSLVSFDPECELFENLGNWNLHLLEGSIAIDAGTSENSPSIDYDGTSRPQGEGYDIGAYEYPSTPSPSPVGGEGEIPSRVGFPSWTYQARIAGLEFWPDEGDSEIREKIDDIVNQGVNVIVADCPLGWSYEAWNDDDQFQANLDLISRVVANAHEKGLKVVWYLTGLEVTSESERSPYEEHPEWVQISIDGEPVVFNDISSEEEHWLEIGTIDVWLSPDSPYRDFFLNRTKEIVRVGVDGLWVDTVYLQHSIGKHEDLWPSFDSHSRMKFKRSCGLDLPTKEDWDSDVWKKWIVWRHEDLKDFLVAVKDAAKSVNPNVVFFKENWSVDTGGATQYANDPISYFAIPDISTGHEVSTIGDRVDLGETGMGDATLQEWLDFVTMIKFGRGADNDKPSWILTYGYEPDDAEKLAGVIVANKANYYETRGPSMLDSVGENYRKHIFTWIRENQEFIYGSRSMADVAVLYSARCRDFVDQGGGDLYDYDDTEFFSEYRKTTTFLLKSHIPFDTLVTPGLTSETLKKYQWLILPNIATMSDEEAEMLKNYARNGGKIVAIGETGNYTEWYLERDQNALLGIETYDLHALLSEADQIRSDLPSNVELEISEGKSFIVISMVNLGKNTLTDLEIAVKLPEGCQVKQVDLRTPDFEDTSINYLIKEGYLIFTVPKLKIIDLVVAKLFDTIAPLISNVHREPSSPKVREVVSISATISDEGLGVGKVTLYYRVDEGAWKSKLMSRTDDTWSAIIPQQADGVKVEYYVEAVDKAENMKQSITYFYTVPQEIPDPALPMEIIAIAITIIVVVTLCLQKAWTWYTDKQLRARTRRPLGS